MPELDDTLAQFSILAIETAAADLGIEPLALARRLNRAEIARLVRLLDAALRHVEHRQLHHRIEDLLMEVTDGRMPTAEPESELDWALHVAGQRREEAERRRASAEDDDEEE